MPLPQPDAARKRPLQPADFVDWTTYYRTYQAELVREYLLPRLRQWGAWNEGVRILDVGCGDAGASAALARAGATVCGIDIEERRLGAAAEWVRAQGLEMDLRVADITDASTLQGLGDDFDLVLFRDVLEHIPDVDAALEQSRARLRDGGGIVVIYPPYPSPFGGHQQILHPPRRFGVPWAKLPFIHWLPLSWWRSLQRDADGRDDHDWEEILTIRSAHLTQASLRRRARAQGLHCTRATAYLSRPSFRLRYGTPVLGAGALSALPGLREILVTGAWELYRSVA